MWSLRRRTDSEACHEGLKAREVGRREELDETLVLGQQPTASLRISVGGGCDRIARSVSERSPSSRAI